MTSPRNPAVQTVGEKADPAGLSAGPGAILIVLGLTFGVILTLVVAFRVTRPSEPERVALAFAAAIDAGDPATARTLIVDPTIVMWPTYWSVLNLEHISPFGDRLTDFVDYHHALGTETTLSACKTRPSTPEEITEYDNWVRCEYVMTDALARRLEGPSGSTSGQLSFGLANGKIRTVFAIRSDRPPELSEFRSWLNSAHPESYAELLTEPAVLQLDVPIIGLVVTDYRASTAEALIEFADEYVGTTS